MKRTRWAMGCALVAALLFGSVSAATAQEAQAPLKIAVVDLDFVVSRSSDGQALNDKLNQFRQDVQAQLKQMTEERDRIEQQIEDGANSLSEDRLAELQKQFEDQQIAIRRLGTDKQREGEKLQAEGLQAIEKKLEPVLRAIQDEEGYDLILNRVPGVVVTATPKVDITPKVLERMNAYQAEEGG